MEGDEPRSRVGTSDRHRDRAGPRSHDSRGRISSVSCPAYGGYAARTVAYGYAVGGNPLASAVCDDNVAGSPTPLSTGPCARKSGVIQTSVDLLGRVVSYIDVWGEVTTTTYDGHGRPRTRIGPTGTRSFFYDAAGRQRSQSLDGKVIAISGYDSAGRPDNTSYPAGPAGAGNGTSLASIAGNGGRDGFGRLVKSTGSSPAALPAPTR